MIGKYIGAFFVFSRNAVARGLLKLGVTPNKLTLMGMAITAGAGVCYAVGAGKGVGWSLDPHAPQGLYLMLAGALLILASACDMLDGAVARIGNLKTTFGGFLDSTLDRYSDFAVFAGIAVFYAAQTPGNMTMVLLAMLSFFNAFMISYTRARAEDLIESCNVGYWQRGERSAAILIATFSGNIPALLVQQAFLPMLTALRRVFYTKKVLEGGKPVTDVRSAAWHYKIRLWRWPRGTWAYDVVTGTNIAWLILGDFEPVDVLRKMFL